MVTVHHVLKVLSGELLLKESSESCFKEDVYNSDFALCAHLKLC